MDRHLPSRLGLQDTFRAVDELGRRVTGLIPQSRGVALVVTTAIEPADG